jgi:Filamentation induced by cAMP protein Fic-like, C-terminal domain
MPKITGEVERLVLALEGPMSRVQIQQALGLRHEDHFRAKYLIPALQSGFVEMTIPDRPKSNEHDGRIDRIIGACLGEEGARVAAHPFVDRTHIYRAQESGNTGLLASRAAPYLRDHNRAG